MSWPLGGGIVLCFKVLVFFFFSLHLYSFPILFIIVLFRMLPEVFKAEGEVKTVSVVSCDSSRWLTLCQRSRPSAECSACVISRNSPSSPAGAALLLTVLYRQGSLAQVPKITIIPPHAAQLFAPLPSLWSRRPGIHSEMCDILQREVVVNNDLL